MLGYTQCKCGCHLAPQRTVWVLTLSDTFLHLSQALIQMGNVATLRLCTVTPAYLLLPDHVGAREPAMDWGRPVAVDPLSHLVGTLLGEPGFQGLTWEFSQPYFSDKGVFSRSCQGIQKASHVLRPRGVGMLGYLWKHPAPAGEVWEAGCQELVLNSGVGGREAVTSCRPYHQSLVCWGTHSWS